MAKSKFQVDSRLPTLLSEEYTSSERALKELVDNAWDADASHVRITLPEPMSSDPIVIEDNGSGMTEEELNRHYLFIASDRRTRSGARTAAKFRLVKGRKGIGKFAGFVTASVMQVETWARGKLCCFVICTNDLSSVTDIEEFPLDIQTTNCDDTSSGTRITLSHLHQHLKFPNPNKFRQELLREYGRTEDFDIVINDKKLDVDDVAGTFIEETGELQGIGKVCLRFAISEKKNGLKQPGIVIKVDGKAVGEPCFFGLEKSEDIPPKLLQKLYGEIDADGLLPHVTAGWGAIVENSELLEIVRNFAQVHIRKTLREQFSNEMRLAQARLQKKVNERLAALPDYKREYADRAIKKILGKYYGEPEGKVEPIVFVLLEALERNDYRALLEHIAEADKKDIVAIAESLNDFSLAEMALLVERSNARLKFLDNLEILTNDPNTLEATIHKALEKSLWIFGAEFSLFSSNKTLKSQIEAYLGKKYSGDRATKRPDLLLNENLNQEYLLIEFKRPAHKLSYEDYQQATSYRNDFRPYTDKSIRVLLIGGSRGIDLPPLDGREPSVQILLFNEVISTARKQLEWLSKQLLNDL